MAEVKDDGENPSHLQNVKITDSQRRTRLMKKLHKIKLSQTLGNFSFCKYNSMLFLITIKKIIHIFKYMYYFHQE